MKTTTRILLATLFSALAAGPAFADHGHRDRDRDGHREHAQKHERSHDRHAKDKYHRRHYRDEDYSRHHKRHDRHQKRHARHHDRHHGYKPHHKRGHKYKHHARKHDRRYHGRVNGYYYASTPWKIQLFDHHHRLRSSIPLGRGAHWKIKGNRIVVYGRHRVHVYGGPRFHLIRSYSRHHHDYRHGDSELRFSLRF